MHAPLRFRCGLALALILAVSACGEGPSETGRRLIEGSGHDSSTVPRSDGAEPEAGTGGGTLPGSESSGAASPVTVTSSPGQTDVSEAAVTSAEAFVGPGGNLVVRPVWAGSPAPCRVLDHASFTVSGETIEVHIHEGGSLEPSCSEATQWRTTDVVVGPVPPGTYRLHVGPATGGRPASVEKTLQIPASQG